MFVFDSDPNMRICSTTTSYTSLLILPFLTGTDYLLRGRQPLRQDPWHRSEGLHPSDCPGPRPAAFHMFLRW